MIDEIFTTRCGRRKVRWSVVAAGYIHRFLVSLILVDSLYAIASK